MTLVPFEVTKSIQSAHSHSFATEGVFQVTTKNAVVPIELIYSVNTYLGISLSHEGVREVT